MKSWAWGAVVLSVFALGACKKSSSSSSSTTSTSSTTGGGGDSSGSGGSTSGTNSGGSTSGTNSGGASTTGSNTTGSNTTGSNTTGSNTTGSNTTGSGTGGSAGVCDQTGVCQDQDQDPTNDCVSCALQGDCAGQLQACGQDADCCTPQADGSCGADSFVGCINGCASDAACQMACAQNHQQGAALYQELVICAICDACPIDCDGPGSGCP